MHLVTILNFGQYQVGQPITDADEIARIEASELNHYVVRVGGGDCAPTTFNILSGTTNAYQVVLTASLNGGDPVRVTCGSEEGGSSYINILGFLLNKIDPHINPTLSDGSSVGFFSFVAGASIETESPTIYGLADSDFNDAIGSLRTPTTIEIIASDLGGGDIDAKTFFIGETSSTITMHSCVINYNAPI